MLLIHMTKRSEEQNMHPDFLGSIKCHGAFIYQFRKRIRNLLKHKVCTQLSKKFGFIYQFLLQTLVTSHPFSSHTENK